MAYTDDYTKTNWQNTPSVATPLNQTNLNHAEQGIKNNCGRIANLDTTKANQSDLLLAVKTVSFDSSTGTFTFTLFNNTTITINTDIEKIPVNIDYDDDPTSAHYQSLIIELDDGTYKYVDMSALITQYEFTNTSTIAWTIAADGKVTANVVDGSITASKLQPNYLADCVSAKNGAELAETNAGLSATAAGNSANSAASSKTDAEAWAVGTRNGVPVTSGDPTYNNNSEYWATQSHASQVQADWSQSDNTQVDYIKNKPDLTLLQTKQLIVPITIGGTLQTTVEGALGGLNTTEQPKTLATPITVGGTSQTTVEAALGAINTDKQSKTLSSSITVAGTSQTTVEGALGAINTMAAGKASTATYTATIPTISGSSATVAANGILAGDNPIVDINFDGTESTSTINDTLNAWAKVWRITTQANQITVYVTGATSVTIPIQLKVVR